MAAFTIIQQVILLFQYVDDFFVPLFLLDTYLSLPYVLSTGIYQL